MPELELLLTTIDPIRDIDHLGDCGGDFERVEVRELSAEVWTTLRAPIAELVAIHLISAHEMQDLADTGQSGEGKTLVVDDR